MTEALKIHRSDDYRLRKLDAARYELNLLKSNASIYSDSVDARLQDLGAGQVDAANPLQAAAFVARMGESGHSALSKRHRMEAAITCAEMTLDWLAWELRHAD